MNKKIIAFTGDRGVGKTKLAKSLATITTNATVISYADQLRNLLYEIAGEVSGETLINLTIDRNTKEVPLNRAFALFNNFIHYDCSPRDLLINLGTFVRSINKDYFCEALNCKCIMKTSWQGINTIFIDDLRFENEFLTLKEMCLTNEIDLYVIELKREGIEESNDYIKGIQYKTLFLPEIDNYSEDLLKEILFLITGE